MFRKHTLMISLIAALFIPIFWFPFGQALAPPIAQTDLTPEWDEGGQAASGLTQSAVAISAVATTPGTVYRTFSGTRFQSTNSALTYSAFGGAIYATALVSGYSFSMDFDLPDGVIITEVVFFVFDNDAATNMTLQLRPYNPETGAIITLESI